LNIEIIRDILLGMICDHHTTRQLARPNTAEYAYSAGQNRTAVKRQRRVQCNENDLAIVNNNENTMSGRAANAAAEDRKSLGSLGKSGAVALQQEQWKGRPESMRKQSNNNTEQYPMEPRPARRQQGRLQTASELADRC
jgi:hypothetical protein